MDKTKSARKWFIKTALSYLGTSYLWAGDDPSGFDCSGLVIECLKSSGVIKEHIDLSADGLLHKFQSCLIERPSRGCLAFVIKKERAVHVAICLDDHFQISSAGGSKLTDSSKRAREDNAFSKIRPISRLGNNLIFADPFHLKFK